MADVTVDITVEEGDTFEVQFPNDLSFATFVTNWQTFDQTATSSDYSIGPRGPITIPPNSNRTVTLSVVSDGVAEPAETFRWLFTTTGTAEGIPTTTTTAEYIVHIPANEGSSGTVEDVPTSVVDALAATAPAKEVVDTTSTIVSGLVDNLGEFQNREIDNQLRAEIAAFADPDDYLGVRRANYIAELESDAIAQKAAFEAKTGALSGFADKLGKALLIVGPAIDFAENYVKTGDSTEAAIVAGRKLISGILSGEAGTIIGTTTTALLAPILGPGAIPVGIAVGTYASTKLNAPIDNLLRIEFNQWAGIPEDTGQIKQHLLAATGAGSSPSAASVSVSSIAVGDTNVAPAWSFNSVTGEFKWLVQPTAAQLASINAKLGIEDGVQAGLHLTDSSGTPVIMGTGDDDYIRVLSASTVIDGCGGKDTLVGAGGGDALYGGLGDDLLQAGAGKDVLDGEEGNDKLQGGVDSDLLFGHSGNDALDGGTGADRMAGGLGNDIYFVDNAADVVIEAARGGKDLVYSAVTYTLGAGQEIEALSADKLADKTAINLTGNALGNQLRGNAGNNILNGMAGADTMIGLGGNDTYYVDNAGDVVTEAAGGGSDRVLTGISYALGAGQSIELFTTNKAVSPVAINLTGNELAQTINGNAGKNVIDGKGGADTMYGFGGYDSYVVDNAGDRVFEAAHEGIDVVYASVNFTLTAGQEIETLSALSTVGTTALDLTGNAFNNTVRGNAGNNVLNGGAGSDILISLGGRDTFLFNTTLKGGTNIDSITDFVHGNDKILLENAIFSKLTAAGMLAANAFFIGAAAHDADDRIIYDSDTGALIYDSNGNAAGGASQFATLAPHTLINFKDFFVI